MIDILAQRGYMWRVQSPPGYPMQRQGFVESYSQRKNWPIGQRCNRFLLFVSLVATLWRPAVAQLSTINYFPVPASGFESQWGIVAGSDGALWFSAGSYIGRIDLTGAVTQYPVPNPSTAPALLGITVGADGNLWFTTQPNGTAYIGRVCAQISSSCPSIGYLTEYTVPTYFAAPYYITAGPDGNLWFTEVNGDNIGRVCAIPSPACTAIGNISEFSTGGFTGPYGVTAGPDRQVWFTSLNSETIVSMSGTGTITGSYLLPYLHIPYYVTAGSDRELWFTEACVATTGCVARTGIGRICVVINSTNCPTLGVITEYPLDTSISQAETIATGQDGALWFTAQKQDGTALIGRITTDGKRINYYGVEGSSWGIASGPDGAMWFAGGLNAVVGQAIPLARRNGIDASVFVNKIPNASTLANFEDAGVQYAVVEMSQQGSPVPLQLLTAFSMAPPPGIKSAAYCFLYFDQAGTGSQQAQSCASSVAQSLSALSFVALDVELAQGETPVCPAKGPWDQCIQIIKDAAQTFASPPYNVKSLVIYTNAGFWSQLTGNDSTDFSSYPLWNAAHGSFTGYVDPAGNLLCASNAKSRILDLTPTPRGGTGIPSLKQFAPFGGWIAQLGTQYDIGGNEGVAAACLFGVDVDFDVFDPSLFP